MSMPYEKRNELVFFPLFFMNQTRPEGHTLMEKEREGEREGQRDSERQRDRENKVENNNTAFKLMP